ncbi:MAG: cell envelope integrity protein CreD [Mariniphaga sp.]|nr:cell envelope integrity protein CreD [Mariniphaga sp.]
MEKEKQENILDRFGISFHSTLSFKLITIGILVLILLIPKIMILSLINERSENAKSATNEVMDKWSHNQTIAGPILTIPFKKSIYNSKDDKYKEVIQTATFLPKSLNINGDIIPNKLYRSIYDVVVYETQIDLTGTFQEPDFNIWDIPNEDILWNKAQINISINDLRGINEEVKLIWNNKNYVFSPGISNSSIGKSGISLILPLNLSNDFPGKFSCSLKLKGSQNLMFSPIGEKTNVNLTSSWSDPGFIGNFLPKHRNVADTGFEANWNILHFNRNFPQQWLNNNEGSIDNQSWIHESDFGVELITMADHYQKNTRSAKYAILIIVLSFVVFFIYEVFSKKRIHPFQYIMVGSAITIFYLLLLSISEHVGFNFAYLISSIAVLLLVFIYSRSFMPSFKSSLGISLTLATCYAFIFILLQLEFFALLTGSVGLFAILAILMFFTRNINWYKE